MLVKPQYVTFFSLMATIIVVHNMSHKCYHFKLSWCIFLEEICASQEYYFYLRFMIPPHPFNLLQWKKVIFTINVIIVGRQVDIGNLVDKVSCLVDKTVNLVDILASLVDKITRLVDKITTFVDIRNSVDKVSILQTLSQSLVD